VTLLCPENSLKSKAAEAHANLTVREEIRRSHKKFGTDLEQKKGAVAAFLQPVTITFRELLDLRLREGERIECCAKTTK
jgi:hypothetical protein